MLVVFIVKCSALINIMNSSLSNVISDFYKRHPAVRISTWLFLIFINMIYKICESQEKQTILDIIFI